MSNLRKLKRSKQRSKISYQPVKLPANIRFHSYVADFQGCGTIRVMYPHMMLNQFRMEGLNVVTSYNNFFVNDPAFYQDMFFLQFQRSATQEQFNLMQHFKATIGAQTKTPIVYEIDDLLMGIPEWNFAHDYYQPLQEVIPKILGLVDGLVCSTEKLKDIYGKYCKNIRVIPNHLPRWLWGDPFEPTVIEDGRKPRILWGGSQNHFAVKKDSKGGDFDDVLLDFIKKTVDKYQWVFVGALPQELKPLQNKIEFNGWQAIFNFPQYIKNLNIDLAIAPLMKSTFNDCKSNIKMLEYTAIGAPAIYSNVLPYENARVKCDSSEEMVSWIEKMAEDNDLRKEVWEADYNTVEPQLYWEDNDNLRHYLDSYLRLFKMKLP